jgi:hypothetical protein
MYAGAGYAVTPNTTRNGIGVAAMVCGIVGLVFCWVPYFGLILGILGIVLGIVNVVAANKGEANNKGMGIAGLVLGIITVAIFVILIVIGVALFASAM